MPRFASLAFAFLGFVSLVSGFSQMQPGELDLSFGGGDCIVTHPVGAAAVQLFP